MRSLDKSNPRAFLGGGHALSNSKIMSLVKVLLVVLVICVVEGADNGPEQIHLSSTGQWVVHIDECSLLPYKLKDVKYRLCRIIQAIVRYMHKLSRARTIGIQVPAIT